MISVRALVRRRSPEVRELRARLIAEIERGGSETLRGLGDELLVCQLALAELLGAVKACSGCSRGMDGNAGTFDGGLCCSGSVHDVFSPEAVAALAIHGTRPGDWHPATDAHESVRGCVFRGSRGCVLAVRHRPALCLHYICRDLMAELADAGRARAIAAAQDRLAQVMRAFAAQYERECGDAEFEAAFGDDP